jgi:hypothetical protein
MFFRSAIVTLRLKAVLLGFGTLLSLSLSL